MLLRPKAPAARLRPILYLVLGVSLGLAYAVLNSITDVLVQGSPPGRDVDLLHRVVDQAIPLAVGALLGAGAQALHAHAQRAGVEARRADALDARLAHVERDQAVWIVAAATLHEVRNPLHSLGLLLDELVEAPPEDEKGRHALLDRGRTHVTRIREHLAGLRALADHAQPQVSPIDVARVAADVATDLAPRAREAGLDLRVRSAPRVLALGEPAYVRIILENLITNGLDVLKDSRQGGTVDVEVCADGDSPVVRVHDDGPGIEARFGERLFQPLQSTKEHGLGLGLPIARTLARALGGDLRHERRPPWTTTFVLRLPSGVGS